MKKLLPLLLAACVDPESSEPEAIAKDKLDPPVLAPALSGDYILRGQGQGFGWSNDREHVGVIGTLRVTGTVAQIAYYHPFSISQNANYYTTHKTCIVAPDPLLSQFGRIVCGFETSAQNEAFDFHYVVSPDGNSLALEGFIITQYKRIAESGILIYDTQSIGAMTLEGKR